jgi:general secretion pathway protein L
MPGFVMLAQDLKSRPGALWEGLKTGFAWWAGELGAMVPQSLRGLFETGAITIDVTPSEIIVARRGGRNVTTLARIVRDDLAVRTLARSIPPEPRAVAWLADPVILRLPANDALERNLKLPLAARSDLANILHYEVERQSPVGAENIYYDYRVMPAADGLDVSLRIIRRDGVDDVLALCRNAEIEPAAITFIDDDLADGGNFPVPPAEARKLAARRRVVPMLAALACVLVLGVIGGAYLRGQSVADDLSERVAQAQIKAQDVERLQRQIAASEKGAALLARQKRSPATVQVLAEVTRVLPDGAWIYEFEMSGGEVRIHGFAHAAESLIAQFDASPLFGDAQFRSPLMQGPNVGLERFDLSFKIKAAAS